MSYPITAGDVFEAIQAGAREATLQMLKDVDFSTAQGQAQAKALLEQIEGKDFATQATLAQILTKLADPATQTTLAAVLSKLETVSDTLTDGTQKVTLTGHIQEFAVSSWDEIAPDEVPAGSVAILIGTNDIRQTDGEVWLPI